MKYKIRKYYLQIEDTTRPASVCPPETAKSNGEIPTAAVSHETPVTPASTGLTHLSTLGTTPAPTTSRPSAQVSPYNATPSRSQAGSNVHSVINVDEGTSSRVQEKQSLGGK